MSSPPPREVDAIVQDYKVALRDLTFNSKPIINNLTMMAHHNIAAAPAIAQALNQHLVQCHPDVKLPALYLIDSIMKNVGEPYLRLFIESLPKSYPEAYRRIMDEKAKRDFARTIDTWWGIMPHEAVKLIQSRSFGEQPTQIGGKRNEMPIQAAPMVPRPAPHPAPPQIHGRPTLPPQVIPPPHAAAYPHLIPYTSRRPQPMRVVRLLEDLRKEMTVSPDRYSERSVARIMHNLERDIDDPALFRALDERARLIDKIPLIDLIDDLVHLSTSSSSAPVTSHSSQGSRSRRDDRDRDAYDGRDRGREHQRLPSHPSYEDYRHANAQQPMNRQPVPPVIPQAHPQFSGNMAVDVSPLLASLSSVPNLDLASILATATRSSPSIKPVYEDLIKKHDNAHFSLYEGLPRQCKNCGLRFADDAEGEKNLEAHLDAHFRRNVRLKDRARRVIARVWAQKEEDWINNVEAQESAKPAVMFGKEVDNSDDGKNKTLSIAAEKLIVEGGDHSDRTCPICQEVIEVVWDDDCEEWIYKDACKDAQDRIVHVACRQ